MSAGTVVRSAWRPLIIGIAGRNPNGPGVWWCTAEAMVSEDAPGLAVHKRLGKVGWVVAHVESGRTVGPAVRTRRQAQNIALQLATLGDWTRGAVAILEDEPFCQAVHGLLKGGAA